MLVFRCPTLKKNNNKPTSYIIHGVGEEHMKMMSELCSLAEEGKLQPPLCTEHALAEGRFRTAFRKSMESYVGAKQLLDFRQGS